MADISQHVARVELERRLETGRNALKQVENSVCATLRKLRVELAEAEDRFGKDNAEVATMRAEVEQTERDTQSELRQAHRDMDTAAKRHEERSDNAER